MTALRLVVGDAKQKLPVELRPDAEGAITEVRLRPCGKFILLTAEDLTVINQLQGTEVPNAESHP